MKDMVLWDENFVDGPSTWLTPSENGPPRAGAHYDYTRFDAMHFYARTIAIIVSVKGTCVNYIPSHTKLSDEQVLKMVAFISAGVLTKNRVADYHPADFTRAGNLCADRPARGNPGILDDGIIAILFSKMVEAHPRKNRSGKNVVDR
jgi:hypothetical protein